MSEMFFNGWESLVRTLVVGVMAYVALVVILRATGKRTLSKLNAFDFIVTVALGSTLATVLLNKDIALAEGTLAFVLLCGLQYAVTWSSVRSVWIRKIVKSEPRLVAHRGNPMDAALKRERVTLEEVQSAVRAAQLHGLHETDAVILETDGTLSVIPQSLSTRGAEIPGLDPPESLVNER